MEKILVSTPSEVVKVKWDGTRFALVALDREKVSAVIVLNPKEMLELVIFVSNLGDKNAIN